VYNNSNLKCLLYKTEAHSKLNPKYCNMSSTSTTNLLNNLMNIISFCHSFNVGFLVLMQRDFGGAAVGHHFRVFCFLSFSLFWLCVNCTVSQKNETCVILNIFYSRKSITMNFSMWYLLWSSHTTGSEPPHTHQNQFFSEPLTLTWRQHNFSVLCVFKLFNIMGHSRSILLTPPPKTGLYAMMLSFCLSVRLSVRVSPVFPQCSMEFESCRIAFFY